jgi:hypothetical protein
VSVAMCTCCRCHVVCNRARHASWQGVDALIKVRADVVASFLRDGLSSEMSLETDAHARYSGCIANSQRRPARGCVGRSKCTFTECDRTTDRLTLPLHEPCIAQQIAMNGDASRSDRPARRMFCCGFLRLKNSHFPLIISSRFCCHHLHSQVCITCAPLSAIPTSISTLSEPTQYRCLNHCCSRLSFVAI